MLYSGVSFICVMDGEKSVDSWRPVLREFLIGFLNVLPIIAFFRFV